METMENFGKEILGLAKTGSTRVDSKEICTFWKPLSGCREDNRSTLHKLRNPRKTRASKLFELNRCVPKGTPTRLITSYGINNGIYVPSHNAMGSTFDF